jgi:hypothetical protein
MGLLGNGYRHNLTGRITTATTSLDGANAACLPASYNLTAFRRNHLSGEAGFASTAATPSGCRHPVAWVMPQKPGAISSRYEANITLGSTGSGAMGVNGSGTTGIVFGLSGAGGLISSASGSAAITFDAAASLFASKAVIGEATITFGASGATSAIGHTGGTAGTALAASWTPYAIGWLSGSTAEAGLTPTGISNAVWGKAIEAGLTAEQIVRIIAAYAAGAATGLEGANPQFTGLDGTTLRIDGTYSAGTRTIDSLNGG